MDLPRRSMRQDHTVLSETREQAPEAQEVSVLLAKGQRGGRIWCAWEATFGILDELQRIEASFALPEEFVLYADDEGYVATQYRSSVLHWLPFVLAPRYTKKYSGNLLNIGEGRPSIRRQDESWGHTRMLAVADRMQRQGDDVMWYLVTWKLQTIRAAKGR
jgi:hypothetical protein